MRKSLPMAHGEPCMCVRTAFSQEHDMDAGINIDRAYMHLFLRTHTYPTIPTSIFERLNLHIIIRLTKSSQTPRSRSKHMYKSLTIRT